MFHFNICSTIVERVCFLALSYQNHGWMMMRNVSSQDGDEDRSGVSEGSTAVVLRQRSRRSGEDAGEPEAGPVHPQQRTAARCHADHQLHHLRPAARPLLSVRAHRPQLVRGRPHMCVLISFDSGVQIIHIG